MIRILVSGFIFLLFPLLSFAQITKQSDWQQEVNYVIHVELDDVHHILRGSEVLTYTNNSDSLLTEIYMHLWPNAYKNNQTAFAQQQIENKKTEFLYLAEENRGYIDSVSFLVDGAPVKWELTDKIDIAKITLSKPLLPGQKIQLSTPFKVKLPNIVSRMGHQNQLYCITQWYPKPAVYDVNGWNPISYLDQGEFYSEFGSFEVFITLPQNYVVGATGVLQNEDEKKWLLELSKTKRSSSTETPPSSLSKKTLHYKQDRIHDFAWFADKRFQVEHSEIVLPKSGNKVETWWFQINPKHSNIALVDSAVLFYSSMLGEYPYSQASVAVTPLISGAGMEYPMITNITETGRQVVFHEVGHNWLYGILGSNERMYPWMDESINNYYETRSAETETMVPYERLNTENMYDFASKGYRGLETRYLLGARKNEDQACFLPSEAYTDFNYGAIIYGKASSAFHYLQQYMGTQKFDEMMQAYYEKWKFKHPLPQDFIDHAKQFNNNKNLDWFFDGLMNTTDKQDWKISRIRKTETGYSVHIKNKSDYNAPFSITALYKSEPVKTIWFDSLPASGQVEFPSGMYDELRVDGYEITTDLNRKNNGIRTSGMFKSVRPIEFSFLLNTENPYKQQVYYTPIAGANLYNKTMLGMAFYNSILPAKPTEFMLAPMYAFGTKDLAGSAELQHRFLSHGFARSYVPWIKATQYASDYFTPTTYTKFDAGITVNLTQHYPRTGADNRIIARVISISERDRGAAYTLNGASTYAELTYQLEQKRLLQPYSYSVTYQLIHNLSWGRKLKAEATRFFNYEKAKKGFTARVFGGVFFQSLSNSDGRTDFRAGSNTGLYDYTFDQSQFGRGENPVTSGSLFAQQLMSGDLQFKELYPMVSSDKWAAGLNMETTVPGILPIVVYADVAFINANESYMDGNTNTMVSKYTPKVLYTSGISLKLGGDVFRINFPIMASSEILDYFKGNTPGSVSGEKRYTERISFSLNLNKLNPLKYARNLTF